MRLRFPHPETAEQRANRAFVALVIASWIVMGLAAWIVTG